MMASASGAWKMHGQHAADLLDEQQVVAVSHMHLPQPQAGQQLRPERKGDAQQGARRQVGPPLRQHRVQQPQVDRRSNGAAERICAQLLPRKISACWGGYTGSSGRLGSREQACGAPHACASGRGADHCKLYQVHAAVFFAACTFKLHSARRISCPPVEFEL